MTTEKRYIDVTDENIQAVLEKVPYYPDEIWKFTAMTERFQTVDAVEVVRCKDCRHRIHDEVTKEWFCNSWHSGFVYVKPNDFCSYGERKCPDE